MSTDGSQRGQSEAALDRELVARVQAGDERAFAVLVNKYQVKIGHLVARYMSSQGDIDDVVQESFIKAYRALDRFRGDSAFYTWLYRIAINTAKNHIVAQSRRPPASDIDVGVAEIGSSAQQFRDIESPERLAMTEELKQVLMDTLEGLPEELRDAIRLREFEGLSYEEIAQTMDWPIGTVRSRIFRARAVIEKAISPMLK